MLHVDVDQFAQSSDFRRFARIEIISNGYVDVCFVGLLPSSGQSTTQIPDS